MKEQISGLFTRNDQEIPLQGVSITGAITGRMAALQLSQRYRNQGNKPLEVVYRFPLPEGGTLHGFQAIFAERVIHGEIEEKEKAFEQYDEAMLNGDQAFLLDEERPNIFTLSLGNLRAGEDVTLELDLLLPLEGDTVEARLSLPTTIAPRYLPAGAKEADGQPSADRLHPEYAAKVPYGMTLDIFIAGNPAGVSSPSHPVEIDIQPGGVNVRLAAETVAMDRDFRLNIRPRNEESGHVYQAVHNGETFYHLEFTPSQPANDSARPPREIIFLLDCSGSMSGSSIECARRALRLLLKALSAEDRFNVVRFGSNHEMFFPESQTIASRLDEALSLLEKTDADLGGTEVMRPLKQVLEQPAAKGYLKEILLITDGDVGNEAQIVALAGTHAGTARIFPVGIGHGPNEFVLAALARACNGESLLIAPGERIEPPLLRLFGRLGGQRLENPAVNWGNDVEIAPATFHLLPGRPTRLFARCTTDKDAETLQISYQVNGETVHCDLPVTRTETGRSTAALWARERIRDLEENRAGSRQRDRGQSARMKAIIEISRRYSIPCQYTSFVGVAILEEKIKDQAELSKIPTLFTHDWHGRASEREELPMGGGALLRSMVCHSIPKAMPILGAMMPPPAPRGRKSMSKRQKQDAFNDLKMSAPMEMACEADPYQPAPADPMEQLYRVLDAQLPLGGFQINRLPFELPSISEATLQQFATDNPQLSGPLDASALLMAALVIAWLEDHFPNDRDIWEAVVEKTWNLLKSNENFHVGPLPLLDWAHSQQTD